MSSEAVQYDPNNIPSESCIKYLGYSAGPYHYRPSLAAGIVFCVLFGASLTAHAIQAYRARRWWQYTFAVGAAAELIGWAGRSWSWQCPYQTTPFLMQISTLIFAPAFFTAGTYVILGRLIKLFGPGVSPIAASTYLYIFVSIDVVSLVMQAVGGGIAASALSDSSASIAPGNDAMIAGIVFQLASILVFSLLAGYVIYRAKKLQIAALDNSKVRWVISATAFSVLCVVIRGIYRTIEMLEGWRGYLITTQRYFIVLDGCLMILAVAVFNVINPGWSEGATTWSSRRFSADDMEKGPVEQSVVSESE
ncbi:MAG: hypothetical protein M1818_001660 [Claussenomyces sp. TS43310]|nr:MAG: hypothetical protein M1818_001660 [Claussenomyces sp. TS43310]